MKTRDVFSYSFGAIKLRKLRAGLTTLGVVVGIAAIVALLSITQGLQSTISAQLQSGLSTNTLIVTAGRSNSAPTGPLSRQLGSGSSSVNSGFKLYVDNATDMTDLSPDIEESVAVIQRAGYIQSGENASSITIVGVDFSQYASVYSSTFIAESGSIPTDPLNETVVVGKSASDPEQNGTVLFSANDSVQIIWSNATTLPPLNETYTGQVSAVLKPIGGFGVSGAPSDSNIYIPLSQAEDFFGTEECNMIIVKLRNSDSTTIDNVSKVITEAFSNEVTVQSSTAMLNTFSSVFSTIQLFLTGTAAISLLVAGIGIMNIMIVSLIERTREIGILKALGMKSRTVLSVFLSESVIIGLLGAAIGILTGWGLANIVATILFGGGFMGGTPAGGTNGFILTPVLTPTVLVGAFSFGIVVSVVFALYPAWRASKLKPVNALRYE